MLFQVFSFFLFMPFMKSKVFINVNIICTVVTNIAISVSSGTEKGNEGFVYSLCSLFILSLLFSLSLIGNQLFPSRICK